jgi:excisionase family DNA binding protein
MKEQTTKPEETKASSELITVSQAAAILGRHRATVHRMIERGEFEAYRQPPRYRSQGRKLFLKRTEVERLAQGSSRGLTTNSDIL